MRGPAWLDALAPHAARLAGAPLAGLLAADPGRAGDWSLRVGPLWFNYARQRLDRAALAALCDVAAAAGAPQALRRMVDGEEVNRSEGRAALHTALRSDLGQGEAAHTAHRQAGDALARAVQLAEHIRGSGVTDVVNIGIGGSDLGPRFVVDALRPADAPLRLHFLANVDGHDAARLLRTLDPARTAAVLVSKSFGTQETLLNGAILRDWLGGSDRLHAVSANVERAAHWGIAAERVLPMWDWVGGRFSLWSAAGFAILLALGEAAFRQLLDGAAQMDAHALDAPVAANMPVLHALLAVWNRNALGFDSQAVLPYDQRLALLPQHLQQLLMESLGKSVRADGTPVGAATVPVIWGGPGTSSQHSFFQALHQGTDIVPCEFIGVAAADHGFPDNHAALLAHFLAQPQALANGAPDPDPQRAYPGGRPSSILLLDRLTPESVGTLVALYEHSVAVQATLWAINAFDQWGVELGKRIANELLPAVEGNGSLPADPVTRLILQEIQRRGS